MAKVKYSKELMEEAAKNAYSITQVCKNIGLSPVGGNLNTVKKKLQLYNIDTSHFTGQRWNKGLKHINKTAIYKLEDILQENINYSSDTLKKRLIAEGYKESKCEVCGYEENLELHHINGNHYDNHLENLQILCPNCHAKTDNFRNRNSKKEQNLINLSDKYKKDHMCICKNCNKEFYSDRTDRTRKFCCRECYTEYLKRIQSGENLELLQDNTNIENVLLLTEENLLKEIPNHNNMTSLAKVFNVSRPTIRKYLDQYGLLEEFKSKFDFRAKEVIQYDINNNIIKEWPSITDASETLNIDSKGIIKCCKFERKSAGGYKWKYKE